MAMQMGADNLVENAGVDHDTHHRDDSRATVDAIAAPTGRDM